MRFRNILTNARVSQNLHFLLGTYRYEPLPSPSCIRLLELIPSTNRSVVQCSLRPYELQDAPPFRALSYTWGNPSTPTPQLSKVLKARRTHLRAASAGSTPKVERFAREDETGNTRRHSIVCDGQIIKVRSNLRDALQMLASSITSQNTSTDSRYYWIDALCVDQENILERNAQVAMMAQIFQVSQSVVVWLGKEDEFTTDALTTIKSVAAIPEAEWPLTTYTSFYAEPASTPQYRRPNLSFHNWLGFIALINRPWFQRAWVVQEIALSRSATVICGAKSFSWEDLSRTLTFIKTTKWYHHLRTEKLRHVAALQRNPGIYKRLLRAKLDIGVGPLYLDATRRKIRQSASGQRSNNERNQKPSLRRLLETHRFAKSTDPRDKVYAFLGLADRRMSPFRLQPHILTPNYSLSVQEIYTEAARALLTSSGSLSLLAHVQDPSQTQIPNLPSWVPDYTVALDPYPLRFRGSGILKATNASWAMNVFTLENGLLDVQGYRVDSIEQAALLTDESADPSASWASIVKLALSLELPYQHPNESIGPTSRVEVLWRTLTTNTYNKIYPAPSHTGALFIDYILNLQIRHRLTPWSSADEFQPHHSPLSDSIYPEWRTLLQLEPESSPYCLRRYKERLTTVVEHMFDGTYSPIGLAQLQHEFDQSGGRKRRLFKTRTGYLGTGPRSLSRDDEVWVLHGGGAPFVLRRLPNGNYQLIGEAFVYGIMQGEVHSMGLSLQHITIE